MLMKEKEEYKLYGKTGLGSHDGLNFGWFVGWFKLKGYCIYLARNFESADSKNIMKGGRES
jgi:beta-lactamase class D